MLAIILVRAVDWFFQVLSWLIVARAILSFIRPSRPARWLYELNNVLYALTEPILGPVRNALPMGIGGLDFSPFIVLLLIPVVDGLIVRLINFLLA